MSFSRRSHLLAGTAVVGIGAMVAVSLALQGEVPAVRNAYVQQTAASGPILAILQGAHSDISGDRSEIVDDRHVIRSTRRGAEQDVWAAITSFEVGTGTIEEIIAAAHETIQGTRGSILESRGDIHDTRATAAGDIRAVLAETFDGSTVDAVEAIIDTAKMDNAINRSMIVATAKENQDTRRTTATDVAEVKQSARDGDVSKGEARVEVVTLRTDAHADIKDGHTQMVVTKMDINTIRRQAAADVHSTVKASKPHPASSSGAKKSR